MTLNKLAKECHEANQTWWHDPKTGERLERNKGELLMLIVSEISECMEGERKNLQDDKLIHRKMAEVELADALIRIFDYAGAYGYDLDKSLPIDGGLTPWSKSTAARIRPPENKAEALLGIVYAIVQVRVWEITDGTANLGEVLGVAIERILIYAGAHGYDIDEAIREKMAYNAVRQDHRPESRLAAGGKRW
jgi:NTP pyrophosphatase (non-canonical NTP hydrolase)